MRQTPYRPLTQEESARRGWKILVDGQEIRPNSSLELVQEQIGVYVFYGMSPLGYDGLSIHQVNGGGVIIFPYVVRDGYLYVAAIRQRSALNGNGGHGPVGGFVDPEEAGVDPRIPAERETREEMGWHPLFRLQPLAGTPMNKNSAFAYTPRGEGVLAFSLEIPDIFLDWSGGSPVFHPGMLERDVAKDAATEYIEGVDLIPYADAIAASDMHLVAGAARLRLHLARTGQLPDPAIR